MTPTPTTPSASNALQKARELEEVECMIESAGLQSHSVECGAVTPNDDDTGFVENIEHCDCGLWLILKMRDALRPLHAELERVTAERDALKNQLPEGMENCTIVFEECPVGHGHLRGANWVKHPCLVCESNKLKMERDVALKGYRGMRAYLEKAKTFWLSKRKHGHMEAVPFTAELYEEIKSLLTSFPEIK